MSNTPGSRESTESDAGVDRPSGEDSIPEMGEGEKLKQLLKIKRFEQAQLGKAVGVSKNAVGKWTKLDQFSPRTWERVKDGLIKLGLNPHDIRPTAENQAATEDLTKLVERWPREQLIALRRIMVSDEISKALLMAYIDGALRRYSE